MISKRLGVMLITCIGAFSLYTYSLSAGRPERDLPQKIERVNPKSVSANEKKTTPQQGKPVQTKKITSLRLEGESRKDMLQRLFLSEEERNPNVKRHKAIQNTRLALQASGKNKHRSHKTKCKCPDHHIDAFKENFVGYWILDSIDDWSNVTLLQFYLDEDKNPRCLFYDGTQKHLREQTNDLLSPIQASPAGSDIPVEMISETSLRFFNTEPHLSSDDLTSTIRIQDSDPNLAYAQFWTDWDGTADDPQYGVVENLSAFRRLPQRPDIQLNRLPSSTDWTNPVNIFGYVTEYLELLGQPEKAASLNEHGYIGWENAQALKEQFLTTGIKRSTRVSTAHRGGQYIGVWRTQFPEDLPVTTIHTDGFHHMTPASSVSITGFKGTYEVLNGQHLIAPRPYMTVSENGAYPWQEPESRQHFIYIQFDSSTIPEAYDPNIHGVALIEAQHGPVTPTTQYRETIAAVFDYTVSVYGTSTHLSPIAWVNDDLTIPETWQKLQQGLLDGSVVGRISLGTRTYNANGAQNFYWNPTLFGGTLNFTQFNINDPFGLWASFADPAFDLDIVIENYLDPETVYNTFFTVTGPELKDEPITSQLTDFGYLSNGSQVVFVANPFLQFPDDLVDEFGTHPWSLYAAADNDPGTILFQAHNDLVGGIVSSDFSPNETVAYIRIGDCDAFDSPLYALGTRSLAFGRADMENKATSNWTAALAALVEKLNQYSPTRYILDIRANAGGFAQVPNAFGAVFGGNRSGSINAMTYPGNGQRGPDKFIGSGIQTAFDSVEINATKEALIDADEVAAIFPNGVVRSDDTPIQVIILTTTQSASAGDLIPHSFLGSDPNTQIHDLGKNVTSRIVGDIDGRLFSGLKGPDGLAVDPLNHNLHSTTGSVRSALYMFTEAGVVVADGLGTTVNYQVWTQPAVLLPAWYDTVQWQDVGVTPPKIAYPLGDLKPLPNREDPTTFRDTFLEFAIAG